MVISCFHHPSGWLHQFTWCSFQQWLTGKFQIGDPQTHWENILSAAVKILFDVLGLCNFTRSCLNLTKIGLFVFVLLARNILCVKSEWVIRGVQRNVLAFFFSPFSKMSETVHRPQCLPTRPIKGTRLWPDIITAWKARRLSSFILSFIPSLRLICCSFMCCTRPLWLDGGWILKGVWQNSVFDVACSVLQTPVNQIYQLARSVSAKL